MIGMTPRLRWGKAMAFMGLRRLEDARSELTAMERDGAGFQGISRLYQSRLALLDGRLDEAVVQLRQDLDDDRREKRVSAELLRRYLLARVYVLRGAVANAREHAGLIAASATTAVKATDLQQAAEVFVLIGDGASARTLLPRLEAVAIESPSAFTRSCVHHVRGLLALSQRHAESALDEFRRANAEYQSYLSHSGMARAFQLTGQWVEVAREWREVVDGRGEVLRDGFPPDLIAAQLELGQAYERLNQPARAREYDQQVVDALAARERRGLSA